MKTTKRFGIDIDGTVTDPATFIPSLNKHFNRNLTLDDLTEYDLCKALNISQRELEEWISIYEPTVYQEALPAPNAKETLTEWEKTHELFYISARGNHLTTPTKNWFYQAGIPFHHVELLGQHEKIEASKNHRIDLFFEDKHDNACDISEACDIPVILFDTPYNRDPVPEKVIRVQSWQQAKDWVNKWVISSHREATK
ncbi:5' nucleotidase, NT5C type [Texcoconibacillus texcoconensis]|uniref:Nucleotidase n=1 Tax=Texcoconibacillus texcoconensis TaxID=1095777 RepID=A0A840QRB6_9BACI|nr:hypothetical protein [Texcoconibacillus texcoconensis]MBB5173905.1 hypothetical protein [Texcoconibacillus texcoconensis]